MKRFPIQRVLIMTSLNATASSPKSIYHTIDLTDPRLHSFDGEGQMWEHVPAKTSKPVYEINPMW